jgi:hypothetical protein
MALADPQSITINAIANSLPRTGFSANTGSFTKADGDRKLEISHSSGSRIRHLIRFTDKQTVSNPLVPTQNQAVNMSVHLVIDMPRNGYTVADIAKISAGFAAWATEANLTKVIAGES